jgi:peptide/nickel transport system substrate-binding protein
VSLLLSACGGKTPLPDNGIGQDNALPKQKEGGSMVFGFATELNNFDPFSSMTADARSVNFNIFDGLVNVAVDGSFVPAIAESYSSSADSMTWTFTLRKGVKFHDGKTLGKDDVLYSIQKAIDGGMTGYNKIASFSFDDAGEVLSINLSSPDSGFKAYLTTPIVQKDAKNLATHPVGTGPFSFKEYVEQDHITLVKNNNYWGKKAHLDTVVIKFLSSQADFILNFQAGSIDGFSASADTVEQLNRDEINLYPRNSNSVQLFALNNSYGPFKDVNVRRALCYLIDAETIIRTVNYGFGIKASSPLIPALSKYYDSDTDFAYGKDVEKARELLSASYPDGFPLTITVPSNYNVHVRTAEVIVGELAKVGIDAKIKQVDWATWLDSVYRHRDFEATVVSFDGHFAYPTAFLARYCSDASNNFVNFASSDYDSVYRKAVLANRDEDQIEYFKQCQRILSGEAASVFLEDISMLSVYNKHFQGCRSYPLYAIDFSAIYAVE